MKARIKGKPMYMNTPKTESGAIILDPVDEAIRVEKRLEEQRVQKELQKIQDMKQFELQLSEFKNSPVKDKYSKHTILTNSILVEVFVFKRKYEGDLIVDEDVFEKPTSIVKILQVCEDESQLKVGDITTVTDTIMNIQVNPEYLELEEAMKKRPLPKGLPNLSSIPQFIYGISEWSRYSFRTNKLYAEVEDKTIYLIPRTFILTKICE